MNEKAGSRPESPFWPFSVSVYGAEGVQQECLDLQDRHGVDVNLLLFCAYVGAIHSAILSLTDVLAARAATLEWNNGIVRKLREARRAIKLSSTHLSSNAPFVADLYEQAKKTELAAERIEQAMLETWGQSRIGNLPRGDATIAVATNIRTLLEICGAVIQEPEWPHRLVTAAIAKAQNAASISA